MMRPVRSTTTLAVCVALAAALLTGMGATAAEPLDAHPNPAWARTWQSLNGAWRFAFDPDDRGVKDEWFKSHTYSKSITVPYPWQSELSGIADTKYSGVAWYERDVAIPADAGPRVFLVFGAVDWEASVWLNGTHAVDHVGGYTPFEVELTDAGKPGDTVRVTVRAFDVTDPETPNGKQTGWYTQTGGIWQTVYMESRGASFLKQAHIYPDIDAKKATVKCTVDVAKKGTYTIDARVTAERYGKALDVAPMTAQWSGDLEPGTQQVEIAVSVPNPLLWTPDSPTLYPTSLTLKGEGAEDTANTYFGMRKVSHGTYNGSKYEYILLNNKPVYLRGALHQSFNPKGVYTHPDDAFIRNDYEKAKEFGLDFLRIHIKIDEPRCHYWADRLGVLLMCDIPNYQKQSERAKRDWEATMRAAVARDFNHPSIFAWCCFNETWGIRDDGYSRQTQEWVRDMYLLTKTLDPTRLVEDNSPCRYDHVETDINSWHFYIDRYDSARHHIAEVVEKTFPGSDFNYIGDWRQGTAPLINSEYGGVGAGSGDRDVSWVFLFLTNLLRKYDMIGGYVYTELSDIEWEHNGFMNYDRSAKGFHYPAGITLADLQQDEFPVLDCPPYQRVNAGDKVSIPVLVSHWSEREGLRLRLSAVGTTVDGKNWSDLIKPVERDVQGKPFTVTPCGSFYFTAPDARGLISLVAEVLVDGKRYAANYCVVDVRGGAVWDGPGQFAVSVPVRQFSDSFVPDRVFDASESDKVFGCGAGDIKYKVAFPEDLRPEDIEACRLVAELGSNANRERVEWPERVKSGDCPQTDGVLWPTDVSVALNGAAVGSVTVENDFADARGVLSHVAHFEHGSHGVATDMPVTGAALAALKESLASGKPVTLQFAVPESAKNKGGLAIYGADMGAFPADPTFVFTLKPGVQRPKGEAKCVDVLWTKRIESIKCGPDGHTWRFTFQDPGEDWRGADYNDKDWREAKAGFGTRGTPGARPSTIWETPNIWLRTTVTVPANFHDRVAWVRFHHDEDMEVYVNGKLLIERKGYRHDYDQVVLDERQRKLFRPGKPNTVAIHCRQTGGGQFVDFGLNVLE